MDVYLVNGLPTHPLFVHGAVVLVPLTALALVVCAAWPGAARRLSWVLPLLGLVTLALVLAGVTGCSSKKAAVYEHENFDDSGTFSRSFPVSDAGSCEAARRALLSQGYIITSSGAMALRSTW